MARPCCSNISTACACIADGRNVTGDGTSLNPFTVDLEASCGCQIDGVTITGSGTTDDPFVAVSGGAVVDGVTITGTGTADDPFVAAGSTANINPDIARAVPCAYGTFEAAFPECAAANRAGCVYVRPDNTLVTRPAAGCVIIDSCDNPPGPGNLPEFQGMGPSVTLDNSAATNEFNNTQQSLYTINYTNDSCLPAQVKIESGGWYARYRLLNDTPVTAGLFTGVQGWINLAVDSVVIDTHQAWEVRDEDLNGKTGESVTHSQGGHYAKVFTLQPGSTFSYDIWSQVFTDERTQGLVTMSGKTSVFINQCNDGQL